MSTQLSPGLIVHMIPAHSLQCHPAILLFAPDPLHASIRDLADDVVVRHSQNNNGSPENGSRIPVWHTLEQCRAQWPSLPDGSTPEPARYAHSR